MGEDERDEYDVDPRHRGDCPDAVVSPPLGGATPERAAVWREFSCDVQRAIISNAPRFNTEMVSRGRLIIIDLG